MYEFYCGNVFGHVTWTRFDIFMCGQLKQLGGRRGQIIVYHRQTVLVDNLQSKHLRLQT